MNTQTTNARNNGATIALVGAAGAAALALSLGLGCGTAQAKETNTIIWQTQVSESSVDPGGTVHYQPVSKTVKKYDITGDKKADTLKMQVTRAGNLVLTINGHKAKTVKAGPGTSLFVKVKYLKLNNGRAFLYTTNTGDNGDGTYAVYQGKRGNALAKVAGSTDFPKKYSTHRYMSETGAKAVGNKLLVTYLPMTYAAGTTEMTYTFKYSKAAGKMERTSAATDKVKVASSAKTTKNLHPVKRLKLYMSAKANKVRGYAAEGEKLAITKVNLKGGPNGKTVMFKVKTASGTTGWFKAPTAKNAPSNTLFRETHMAA